MIKKKKQLFWGIFLITILILTFSITRFVNAKPQQLLHHHLPTDANFIVKIDNTNLIQHFLFDLFFYAKIDQNDVQKLRYQTSKKNLTNTGIDFTNEIYVFHEDWKNKNLFGILLHLIDHKYFAKYVNDLPDNIFRAFNDDMACILFVPENIKVEDYSTFEMYANDLLIRNPNRTNPRIIFANTTPKSLFHIYFSGDYDDYVQHLSVETSMKTNRISFYGTGRKNPIYITDTTQQHFIQKEITDNSFHIQAKQIPDTLQHYLNKVLLNVGIDLAPISSQQLYIYGFEVEKIDNALLALPYFDGVFRFEDTIRFDMDEEMYRLSDELKWITYKNSFKVGSIDYYVKQLSPNELYIGIDKNPSIISEIPNYFFLATGNPLSLLNITGKGIIAQIALLLPPVQNTRQFFDDLEHFELKGSYSSSSDSTNFEGEIVFPESKIASLEVMKFLLRF